MNKNRSERRIYTKHTGEPCPHYPHKFKTESAHQAKVACRLRRHHALQKSSLEYRLTALLRTIVARCESHKHKSYPWYGARGIKNFLTLDDLRFLWKRDRAGEMLKPSIDREHRDDNYVLAKCKFIELADNVRRGVAYRESKRHAEARA